MTSRRDIIAALPDDALLPAVWVRALLAEPVHAPADNPDRDLSTTEAADEFGHSVEWWSRRARKVPGAWQETEGAPWSLPRRGCRAYLTRLRGSKTATDGRRGLRGPNKTTHTDARAAGVPAGPVLRGGSAEVEGRAPDAQGPETPRLAG